jgi:hypothetical protein
MLRLPPELVQEHLLAGLAYEELLAVAQVCRHLRALTWDDEPFLRRRMGQGALSPPSARELVARGLCLERVMATRRGGQGVSFRCRQEWRALHDARVSRLPPPPPPATPAACQAFAAFVGSSAAALADIAAVVWRLEGNDEARKALLRALWSPPLHGARQAAAVKATAVALRQVAGREGIRDVIALIPTKGPGKRQVYDLLHAPWRLDGYKFHLEE